MTMFTPLIGMIEFAFLLIGIVLITLISLFTPAWTFFLAWLQGHNIVGFAGKDRSLRFIASSLENDLLVHEAGIHMLDADSVMFEKKSGRRVIMANGEVGITLSAEVMGIMNGLKDMGFDNIDEAVFFDQYYHECTNPDCKLKLLVIPEPQKIEKEGIDEINTEKAEEVEETAPIDTEGGDGHQQDAGSTGEALPAVEERHTDDSNPEPAPAMPTLPEPFSEEGPTSTGEPEQDGAVHKDSEVL